MVDTIAGDRVDRAGDSGCFSKVLIAPLGSLITRPALLRGGIWKLADLGAGLFVPRLAAGVWLTAGVVIGVDCWPMLEVGLSEVDRAEDVRDIG